MHVHLMFLSFYYCTNGHHPLIDAVQLNNYAIVKLFVQNKCIINIKDENGLSCLQWAVLKNSQQMIILWINCGIDLNLQDNDGKCSLFYAVSIGNIGIVEIILNKGIFVELRNKTPIYEAIKRKKSKLLKQAKLQAREKRGILTLGTLPWKLARWASSGWV